MVWQQAMEGGLLKVLVPMGLLGLGVGSSQMATTSFRDLQSSMHFSVPYERLQV